MSKWSKKWLEKAKRWTIVRWFMTIRVWLEDHTIHRKVFTFFALLLAWLSLLVGAMISPERIRYTKEQLNTRQIFGNGSGEVTLVSQVYSPKTKMIVLSFQTKDSTSSVREGIVSQELTWHLYGKKKGTQATMEVIPVADNKLSVIIRHVPTDFDTFAVEIMNHTALSSALDVEIASSKDASQPSSKQKKSDENSIQFYITTANKELKTKQISSVSREEVALAAVKEERTFQEGQIQKLKDSIDQLNQSIKTDQTTKEGLEIENKYLSGADLEANQKKIENLETDMTTKTKVIDKAMSNISLVEEKLANLRKKETAIKDGSFQFTDAIKTIEMK
ncbi:UNVERIFIED_CONTAM: hypothetical protein KB574_01935 [Streptococcus canis]|uniref:Chromosome partition protein Smc n=1 Tax=Streptococcus canis FSL Z3-227 TaxID=482234 RepID=A0AAV3FUE0_STRCB|nr:MULTISPECIES: hypothetical protein [Streptococcus]EIQ82770.1 hypothetical protein SCAZ3_10425 [Streptococcus canis FSL Z3-227]EPT38789.1 hypothetical protein SAG0029_02715 [Streptococcus agalactiae FSL S3-501]MCB2830805.1 hypothetical protein [Streptococcus dysgalactiae subsp. dysgalactiae]MCB2836686.1 hypothetical protein [Streptococcus dysgalactiae subsp. dysgalactiae]MCB2838568.1 hypothetical protein [Streptococcus dysgalactiae subsp. dysgalactiae]